MIIQPNPGQGWMGVLDIRGNHWINDFYTLLERVLFRFFFPAKSQPLWPLQNLLSCKGGDANSPNGIFQENSPTFELYTKHCSS